MTKAATIRRLRKTWERKLEDLLKEAYEEGLAAGELGARGQGRRPRAIRSDATVDGLLDAIRDHFDLDRYTFEIRITHRGSGKRVPGKHVLQSYVGEPVSGI